MISFFNNKYDISIQQFQKELLQIKNIRSDDLKHHQDRVQYHELVLIRIRGRISNAYNQLEGLEKQMNFMVENNIWVTSEQYTAIHTKHQKYRQLYTGLLLHKKERQEIIDSEARKVISLALHLDALEKRLTSIDKYLSNMSTVSTKITVLKAGLLKSLDRSTTNVKDIISNSLLQKWI